MQAMIDAFALLHAIVTISLTSTHHPIISTSQPPTPVGNGYHFRALRTATSIRLDPRRSIILESQRRSKLTRLLEITDDGAYEGRIQLLMPRR